MHTAAATILLLMCAGASAQDFRRLRGPEIAATLTGAELTDEIHWSYVFERGGLLRSCSLGKPGEGSWRVENDELCTTGGPGLVPCHQVL